MIRSWVSGAAVAALLLWGCGDDQGDLDGGFDAGSADAVGSVDGGSVDGGSVDGGSVDGGNVDGGSTDGGSIDAGIDTNGGSTDGGSIDAGDDTTTADAGPCVIERGVTSGQATVYGESALTQCGATLTPWTGLRIAVSPSVLMEGARCGACLRVTGPSGTHIALIDDLCPSCAAADLDLQTEAGMTILGATVGRHPVTWELAPCEPPGNVFYDFQGSNPYYIKIRVSQHTTPVARLELRTDDDVWMDAARTTDGFFVLSPGTEFPLPLGVRATDVFGSTIEFEAPDLASTARDSGMQFPVMCAP